MSYGLLRGALRPGDAVCALRSLVRLRATILRTQSRAVQHMQKALVQMNIQLATVIADVAGASGQAILRAIVAGQRDAHALAAAHKLARLIYTMLSKGEDYTDRGQAYYEQRHRQRVVANLNRRAQQLGLQVVPIAAPA